VRLPVEALQAIQDEARTEGCARFADVPCSAFAELEDQGLAVQNADPPTNC
jgi:hypothetical protein